MNEKNFNSLIIILFFIVIQNVNSQCNSLCASCNNYDGDATDCMSCYTGYFLKTPTGPTTCETSCQDGYFEKGFPDNVCASCDTSCKTCYGDGSDNCLSCDTTYLNLNDECVDPCGTGYVGISGVCEKCDSGCETCDTSQDNCLTCNFGYFHYNVDNTCLTTCPDGYYPSNRQCLQCDSTCFKCDWSTANDCTECTGALYLYDSQCIATCPDGTYTNTASNTCTVCDSTCETCSGPADTECLTCDTYYKGYYFYADENRCLTKAQCESLSPDHVIDLDDVDGENVSCIELICDPTCQTCDQNKYYNCLSCASPRYLLYTQCVNTCLSYQFGDAATRTCMDCASECATCEFTDDYCYTCNDGYYYLAADFVCYDECPIGYYEEDTTMTCDICDANCMECDQTATTCTFCYEGTYLLNEVCITACPDLAYYTDELANACYPCNYQCPLNYCSGPAYSDCLTVCPDGYFEQPSSRTCEPCYPGCTLCDGAATVCSACAPNFLLQGSDCVDDCPVSFYFDETDVACYACDASCYKCEGPSANECTACQGNRFLQGNQCVTGCAGTAVTGDLTDNVCRSCDSSCTACYDYPNQCTACAAGYYLSGTLCQLCSDGYYGSGTACYECHNDCFTCYGPNADNCNSCDPSRTLYLQVSTCQGNCDAGYYLDTSTGICRQCNTGCATCVNKANNCLSCTGYYILHNNKCTYRYCPAGYVIDYTNNICEQCDSTCETCTGTTSSDCSSCEYQKRYYYSGQCLTDCPVGYYKNTYSSTCIHCASECATCADDDGSLCYSCTSGYLEGTTCVTSCSDGYFKVPGIDVCNLCQNIVPSNIDSYCTSSLCPGMKPSDDNQSCEEICGDGIRITDTIECDDGNNEDGDGCSSNCQVEYLWECSGGDGSNPDVCIDKTEIGFTIDTTNTTYYNYGENAIFQMNIEFNKTFTLPLGVAIQDLIYIEIEGHDKQFDYQLYSLNRRMLETQNQDYLYDNQNQQQKQQKQEKYDYRQLTSIQATQYLLEMELTETIRNREISVTFYPKEYFWSLDGSVSLSADSKQVGTIERYMYYSEFERNITALYKYLQPAIGIILIITFINMLRYDETNDNKFYYCHAALDSLQLIYFYRFVDLRWPLEGFRFFEQMVHMTDFFIPNLFAGMKSSLSNQKVFEFYFITSSFLENSGGPLLILFIFLVIFAFVGLFQIQKFYKNHEQNNFYAFFYKIRNVRFQYGIFIDYYLITGTTFFTYGILQFLDPSETSLVSLIISILIFIAYLAFYVYSTQYMIRNQAQLYDKEEMIAEQIKQRKIEYNQYQKKKRENKIKEEIGSLIEIEDQQIDEFQKKNSVDSKEEEFYAPIYELPIVKRAQEDVKFYENLLIDFNQNYEQKITSQLVIQKLESRNVDIDVQLTDSTFRLRNFWTGIKPNDFLKPGSSKSKTKLQRKMNEKIMLYQLIILIRKFLAPLIIVLFNSSAYTQIILLQILHLSIIFGWWFNSFSIFLRKRDNIRAFLSEFLTFLGVCGFYLMISDTSEDEGRRTRISLFCIFIFMIIFLLHFFFLAGEEIKNIYKYLKEQKDRRHKVYQQQKMQDMELQELIDKIKLNKGIIEDEKARHLKVKQEEVEAKLASKNEMKTNKERINELFYTQAGKENLLTQQVGNNQTTAKSLKDQQQSETYANNKNSNTTLMKQIPPNLSENQSFYTNTEFQITNHSQMTKKSKKSKFDLNSKNNKQHQESKKDPMQSTHSSLSLSIPDADHQQSVNRLLDAEKTNQQRQDSKQNTKNLFQQQRVKKNTNKQQFSKQSKFTLDNNEDNEDEYEEELLIQSNFHQNQNQTQNFNQNLSQNLTQNNLINNQNFNNNNNINNNGFQLQKNPNLFMFNSVKQSRKDLIAGQSSIPEGNLGYNGPNNYGFLVSGQQLAAQNQVLQQTSLFPQQFKGHQQILNNNNNFQINQNKNLNNQQQTLQQPQNKLTLRELGKQSMAQVQKDL